MKEQKKSSLPQDVFPKTPILELGAAKKEEKGNSRKSCNNHLDNNLRKKKEDYYGLIRLETEGESTKRGLAESFLVGFVTGLLAYSSIRYGLTRLATPIERTRLVDQNGTSPSAAFV